MATDRRKIHAYLYEALAAASICMLPYSKFLSSLSVILLLVNWLIEGGFKPKLLWLKGNTPALLMIGFFICFSSGIFITSDKSICGFEIQKKLPFLVLGIVLGSIDIFNAEVVRRIFAYYTGSILAATVYCLVCTSFQYSRDHYMEDFFYHSLGSALDFHAVYFSASIFLILVFLISEILSGKWFEWRLAGLIILFVWLSAFLILLASKLLIGVFVFSLFLILVLKFKNFMRSKPALIICLLIFTGSIVVLLTQNPVNKRFADIGKPGISVFQIGNEHYTPGNYFDGLTFRVLLWKFGYKIMHEQKAWLFGVSAGDTQRLLDEKIAGAHLYTGEVGTDNKGYLGYNFHNQFVETTVQSGLTGLVIVVAIFFCIVATGLRKRDLLVMMFAFMFFCFFCTESVLERQMGIMPFVLFTLLFTAPAYRNSLKN